MRERLEVVRALVMGSIVVLGAAGGAAALAGCGCGGGGLGSSCDVNADCDPGLYCDPATLTCAVVDSGPPGNDSTVPESGTDGGNNVGDGQAELDSAVTDAGGDGGGGSDAGTDAGTDAAVPCFDLDFDGWTDCDADCDDGDPSRYPGAPEVCGDAVTNDCLSGALPDTGCMGLGTFVAPPPLGNDANPGTQTLPVATINEGIVHAMTIGGGVDVYVAAATAGPGVYAEDIAMVDGISLWGGHESTGWTRDPAANVTVIENVTTAGVSFPVGITTATVLDGFTIDGMAAFGDAAAITVEPFSSPVISGNVVNAPDAGGASFGIRINPFAIGNLATPLVTGNRVNLGASAPGWFGGGGAWGISSAETPSLIIGNLVYLADDDSIQRGIDAVPAPAGGGLAIQFNVVRGAPGGSTDWGFGIRLGSGGGTIDSNDVAVGTCTSACIGIEVAGSGLVAVITNNVAFGGAAPTSAAMSLAFEGVPAVLPDVLIHSNYFNGGGMGATAGSLSVSVGIAIGENPSSPMVAGRIYDNIVSSGIGAVRYAVSEGGPNIDPEILDSNALWAEPTPAAVTSGLYLDEGASTLTSDTAVNGLGIGGGNLEDACMVTGPVPDGDFHLLPGSTCIDAGNAAELPLFDYEGDPRPNGLGPDIGVDET